MSLPAISDLKNVIMKIQSELLKTQAEVLASLSGAQDRLSTLITSIETVEKQLGIQSPSRIVKIADEIIVENKKTVNGDVGDVGSRNWSINIIELLRKKDMATGEIFEWFLQNGSIRIDNKENRKRDHANVRLALHNLKHKKWICQVEDIRGSPWKLTQSYRKHIKENEDGKGINLDL